MTFVPGPLRRSVDGDSFADIAPGARVVSFDGGVTFDRTLTDAEADAAWWFITSSDDADQAVRANIADLLSTDTTASPLSRALAAAYLGIEDA